MQHYFILLELPGGSELKFNSGDESPDDFWRNAVRSIRKGRANLICRRQDTGVSEALHAYMLTANHFTTFMVAELEMERAESCNKTAIMFKTAQSIAHEGHEKVIDNNRNFQLVHCSA